MNIFTIIFQCETSIPEDYNSFIETHAEPYRIYFDPTRINIGRLKTLAENIYKAQVDSVPRADKRSKSNNFHIRCTCLPDPLPFISFSQLEVFNPILSNG